MTDIAMVTWTFYVGQRSVRTISWKCSVGNQSDSGCFAMYVMIGTLLGVPATSQNLSTAHTRRHGYFTPSSTLVLLCVAPTALELKAMDRIVQSHLRI